MQVIDPVFRKFVGIILCENDILNEMAILLDFILTIYLYIDIFTPILITY